MGNVQSNVDWRLIGRERIVEKAAKLIKGGIYCLQITGLKKIGKSRCMRAIHESLQSDWNCLWKDFQYESNLNAPSEWFRIISTAFDTLAHDKTAFLDSVHGQTLRCNDCENCEKYPTDKSIKCSKWTKCLEIAIDMLIIRLENCHEQTILFLDNVDTLMNTSPAIKDCFLKFLKGCRSKRFKIVFTSTKKAALAGRDNTTIEIEPLSQGDTLKLLYITTDGDDSDSGGSEADFENMFCPENEIFIPENKLCLEYIAELCDGLPLAAIMSGSLLTEYEGMFSPVELLEILTQVRMKTLSPDNCPPDDRLDVYRSEMEEVKELDEQFTSFFENLTEKRTCNFSIQDALAAIDDKCMTSATLKSGVLKKLLDRCVISVKKMPKEHQWRWHGILREANAALTAFGKVSNKPEATAAVLKFTKENAERIGLELDDEVLSNPKAFENAIRRLANFSTEDDAETNNDVLERVEASQGTNIPPPHLLADNSQNNLSIGDNDNHRVGELDTNTDCNRNNDHMNIRVPIEHCMETETIYDRVNGVGNKVEARYTKLDNIDVTSEQKGNTFGFTVKNFGNDSSQELEHLVTFQNTLTKTIEPTRRCSCKFIIQRDQANKLCDYNNALRMANNVCHWNTLNGFEDLPPPYTSVDVIPECRPTEGTLTAVATNRCKCMEHTTRNTQHTRENMTQTSSAETEQVDSDKQSPHHHAVETNFNARTKEPMQHCQLHHSQNRQQIRDEHSLNLCENRVRRQDIDDGNHCRGHSNINCTLDGYMPSGGRNEGIHHLGNCPVHGVSFSEHSNCSFAGPPGDIYEPPSLTQDKLGLDDTHLCALSIDPQVGQCSVCGVRKENRQCDYTRDLTSPSLCPYNSQTGPSAIAWNSCSDIDTGQRTLANQ